MHQTIAKPIPTITSKNDTPEQKNSCPRVAHRFNTIAMKFWPFLIAIFITSLSLHGQITRINKADALFEEGNLQAAIPLYHQILQKQDVPHVKINLAEAYLSRLRTAKDVARVVTFIGIIETSNQWKNF